MARRQGRFSRNSGTVLTSRRDGSETIILAIRTVPTLIRTVPDKLKTVPVIFIILTALLFSFSILNAEDATEVEFSEKKNSLITEEEETAQEIDAYIRYMPSRDAEVQSGKVALIDSALEYSYGFKAFEKLPIEISLDHQYIGIENSTAIELPAHLVGLSLGVETTLPFFNFNKTHLRIAVAPSFYADTYDFPSSSFRIPVQTFLIYQPDTKSTFVLGVAVYPDYESSVWPLFGVIYKPNDKLTFNLAPDNPNISYLLNDRLTLFAEGDISLAEFEVAKDDLKNVVLQYKEMYLGAGIKYKVNKFIYGSLSTGRVFNRSLKYRDSLGKVNIKDGIYTEFRIEVRI